jgi:2Fe-2S ferredoxin
VVKITYIEANGTEHVRDVQPGMSVMEGAVRSGTPGILADCGGQCACGTCRVFVDEKWRAKTGTTHEMEEATLDLHDDKVPGQRLACQMKVQADWDGLVVRMPESQF